MPAKRRSGKVRDHRITPAALEAWRAGDAAALHRALGLKPWEASPLHCDGDSPWGEGTAGAISWPKAQELRAALVAADKLQSETKPG